MNRPFLLFVFLCVCSILCAQPKQEVRAAWITTAYGLDWPRTRATSTLAMRRQQAELMDILDRLCEANFNTVLFQTRSRGDLSYPSETEPFTPSFTGKANGDPGYDPLAFVIEECHKRGMECHAWIVSIPLGNKRHVASLGQRSVTKKKQPAICVPYKNEYFLNPGHPDTKKYLMKITEEIITRYDVDGVHFDYHRYPERAPRFPDNKEFRAYGKGRSLEQWRRDNLTEILRHIYHGVKAIKPWVKVSTCPVGKFQDVTRYSSRGWNAYHTVHQDAQGWLVEGIQDQLYPMLYFREDQFYPFVLDWQEQSNGRHIIPGMGIYFLDPSEGNWELQEIEQQINFTRRSGIAGQGHYRVGFLMSNTQGLYDRLTDRYYATPALQPPMPWLDDIAPSAPSGLTAQRTENGYYRLNWQSATDNDPYNPPTYVIYASDEFPVDTSQPAHILAQRVYGTTYTYIPTLPWKEYAYFAVTAIDRYGNESEPIQVKWVAP
ncbi:MAG: family 10 glycosylhydrolase [Bacteroides sp.]|nr:family 10 glycosylhydrolase [Bacteroides sp.]